MEISPSAYSQQLRRLRFESSYIFLVKSLIGGLGGSLIQILRWKRLSGGFLFFAGFLGSTEIHEYNKKKKELEGVYLPKKEGLFDYIPEKRCRKVGVWRAVKRISELERELK